MANEAKVSKKNFLNAYKKNNHLSLIFSSTYEMKEEIFDYFSIPLI